MSQMPYRLGYAARRAGVNPLAKARGLSPRTGGKIYGTTITSCVILPKNGKFCLVNYMHSRQMLLHCIVVLRPR